MTEFFVVAEFVTGQRQDWSSHTTRQEAMSTLKPTWELVEKRPDLHVKALLVEKRAISEVFRFAGKTLSAC